MVRGCSMVSGVSHGGEMRLQHLPQPRFGEQAIEFPRQRSAVVGHHFDEEEMLRRLQP